MEENSSKSSEEEKKCKLSDGDYSSHHESDNDFTNSTLIDNDPVKVLQLSQPFFVADTLEDDESMMISSQEDTVPFLIPSTPVQPGKGQGSYFTDDKDECITILDETCDIGDSGNKAQETLKADDHPTSLNESDMTQDLPDLDATQELLPCKESPKKTSVENNNDKSLDDDDDWNLKFSETQGTQDLGAVVAESPKNVKLPVEEKAPELEKQEAPSSEEEKASTVENISILAEKNEAAKPETIESITIEESENIETLSDDEIEPSQPCVSEYQGLSSFRFQSAEEAKNNSTSKEQNQETIVKSSDVSNSVVASNSDIPSSFPVVPQNRHSDIPPTPFKNTDRIIDIESKSGDIVDITECAGNQSTESSSNDIDNEELLKPELNVSKKEDVIMIEPAGNGHEKAEEANVKVKLSGKESIFVPEELKLDAKTSLPDVEPPEEKKIAVTTKTKDEKLEISSQVKQKESLKINTETPPTAMLPPLTSRVTSLRKQRNKPSDKVSAASAVDTPEGTNRILVGTFKTKASLQRMLNSCGFYLDEECLQKILSLQGNEKAKFTKISSMEVEDSKVYLDEHIVIEFPGEQPRTEIPVSPHSGSSSSTVSSKTTHSSDYIADVSSSSSGKYGGIFSPHHEATTNSSQLLSSQETGLENYPKTSTQNSDQPKSFINVAFGALKSKESDIAKDEISVPSTKLSPIKSEEKEESEKNVRGRRTTRRKATTAKSKSVSKSNRSRSGRKKSAEDSDSSKKAESSKEVKPKKETRSRKTAPSKKVPVVEIDSPREIPIAEDSGGAYEESHFGNITPGVRVMARWKDGFYYPGTVQSQELEGRWVVMFDDGDTRIIAQENLMKLAMLQIGTSVLVQSSDQFYDPGIVCGHFREGNKVGYEVELDSGVTRRYPRSNVILSTDQAKLITSSRPPTTPATVTINLDNIIDGKRKRKSVQSPGPSPVLKKSPRISQRTSKLDSNLDSTAGSTGGSAGEAPVPKSKEPESTETEDDGVKPRKRVRKAAVRATVEVAKVLPKRTSRTKLFKDHAFLLTNAEKKVMPRSDDSDNTFTEGEENLFNKDQICSDIILQGGLVLDKFEDIQKCTRKTILLLASSHLRTIKYIQCLAAGILCIKHNFVADCCLMAELLKYNNYLLPAGYSIVSKDLIDWHGKSDALKGLKIALISAPESHFVHIWAPVLLAAKADFVQKWNLPSSKSGSCAVVDVLITNHLCPQDVLQSAKKRKIPVVSSEWIIQSLIAGKRLPFNAHPKFKHDYSE